MTIDFSNPAQVFIICLTYLFISFVHFCAGITGGNGEGHGLMALVGVLGFLPFVACIVTFIMMIINAI